MVVNYLDYGGKGVQQGSLYALGFRVQGELCWKGFYTGLYMGFRTDQPVLLNGKASAPQ